MLEYKEVVNFFYNGFSYHMYLDNNNRRYFLKDGKNGELEYLTLEEYVDIIFEFKKIPLVMNAERGKSKNKIKLIPKIIIGGVAVTLSISVFNLGLSVFETQKKVREFEEKVSARNQELSTYVSYLDDEEPREDLVVDTYLESDTLKYLFVYDMDYLDKALDYSSVSLEDLKKVIAENNKISDKFKKLLYEYCEDVVAKYPNLELRVLYENLKTLEVVECDKRELMLASLSIDSYGCYIRTENKIYVLEDYEYEKGTWAYQVIYHEFSHCLRTGYWETADNTIKVQVEGLNFSNVITAEALNSLFTVSLFDYEELDIAYQLQSNYHSVIIDCMDNYSIEDYVGHSVSYYAKKLDEFNKDDNYATVILELIQMQYDDFHSDKITVAPEEYYPIYDYIADMYYKKYLNSDMSYSEAVQITDRLLERILFDVPEEYNIPVEHFYEHLKEYCNELGIESSVALK